MIKVARPIIEKPKVLVVEEKDGTAYFHITDDTALHKAALFLVTQRFQQGWYGEADLWAPVNLGVTESQVEAMPPGKVKDFALAEFIRYHQHAEDHEDEVLFYEEVKRAIEIQDGMEAWRILQDRVEYEYERVYLQPYCKAK